VYASTNPEKQNLNEYICRTKLESNVKQEDMKVCDGQLSMEECTEAIFKMKLNKSLGIDGLTVEFYRTFWDSIECLIVFILNKSHEDNQLSFSQKTSILTILFKKDDPLKLDNYRPISLLNIYLQLLSYTLAHRFKKILPKLINEDQTGYINNRLIGFNIGQIQDIIDYSDIYKIEISC
jgi:hypothetical protein